MFASDVKKYTWPILKINFAVDSLFIEEYYKLHKVTLWFIEIEQ